MHKSILATRCIPRRSALATCLASALGLASAIGAAATLPRNEGHRLHRDFAPRGDSTSVLPPFLRANIAPAEAGNPAQPGSGMDHLVTKCDDDGSPGTLRAVIADPMTQSGDSINLTQLTCSKITLAGTAIKVQQNQLRVNGPGADELAIDANHASRVFEHAGGLTLTLADLAITNGTYVSGTYASGGCIYSRGNVYLFRSMVSSCVLEGTGSAAYRAVGGGVSTWKGLELKGSTITGNHILTINGSSAGGGGAYVFGDFLSFDSTVSDNSVAGLGSPPTFGGGVLAFGSIYLLSSTISGNRSGYFAGLDAAGYAPQSGTLSNSTISGNTAVFSGGGIYSSLPLEILDTTVAFNTSGANGFPAGLYSTGGLTLLGSIIADNAGPQGRSDLGGSAFAPPIMGANNLVTSSTLNLPLGTIPDCPMLDPLADNGGSTRTHKLRHTSPAIDQGDPGNLTLDQRGAPRVYPDNGLADIGAVEWQPTDVDERLMANGFDGVCDR